MSNAPVSRRIAAVAAATNRFRWFLTESPYVGRMGDPEICDFTFGNPHELPLPGVVEALKRWAEPRDKNWFAYTLSSEAACAAVAEMLREWRGLPFEPEDIAMTSGAFGAIAAVLQAFLEPGDEVVFSLPPWFNYESMIVMAGGVPVKVPTTPETFDLDVGAIEAAITGKTRLVIVNSPNNPTGRIYPPETLDRLARVLGEASHRIGHRIFILSDEPYARLVFDGRRYHSPSAHYPDTLIAYSYGKVLLIPGQRIGWLALNPDMAGKEAIREAIGHAQISAGWLYPNALLQHAIRDLNALCLDLDDLQAKRDRMVAALREIGYDVHLPEGTFYLLPRSPLADDEAFAEMLADGDVFVMPGSVLEIPGYFRVSLTANHDMIERSLPTFREAFLRAAAVRPADR